MAGAVCSPRRRQLVNKLALIGVGAGVWGLPSLAGFAAAGASKLPDVPDAIESWANGRALKAGRVQLALPPLVENGFLVRMSVQVDSPMTKSDHIQEIRIFSEVNPSPFIANFYLGPDLPEARVETRIRLADTQSIWAVAQTNSNELWYGRQQVIVTLAACAG